jgi:Flp pilus assembly protein TadD
LFKNLFKKKRGRQDKITIEDFLSDAIDHFENGNFGEAADHFNLIAQSYPEHPLANLMLGRAYIELKKYGDAIEALFRHLKIDPNSVEALINLGLIYYECGDLDRAKERFEQALDLRKISIMVRENLAITKVASGELEYALDNLVSLHEEKPDDQNITELLVLTLGKLGRWETAMRYAAKLI